MKAYHKEIVENAVAYIAEQYLFKTDRCIPQSILFKILALFDFEMLRQTGVPSTGLKYYAYRYGHVPNELYLNWTDTDKTKRIEIDGATCFKPTDSANRDYLSKKELSVLDCFINRAVAENWDKAKATEVSHDEIKAWRIAFNKGVESLINYEDEFDGFSDKSEDEMTPQEQRFLRYQFIESQNA